MPPDAANKAVCSVVEAAEILGVHPTTAQRWAKKGKLRVVAKLPGETGSYVLDRRDVRRRADQRARRAAARAEAEAASA